MVIGYIMKKQEMTFDEALSYVQERRPVVAPNEAFLEQLRRYDQILAKLRADKPEDFNRPGSSHFPIVGPTLHARVGPELALTRAVTIPSEGSPSERPLAKDEAVDASARAIGPQLPPHLLKRSLDSDQEVKVQSSPKRGRS